MKKSNKEACLGIACHSVEVNSVKPARYSAIPEDEIQALPHHRGNTVKIMLVGLCTRSVDDDLQWLKCETMTSGGENIALEGWIT